MIIQNKEFRESHSYGAEGGNCDLINVEGKCPLSGDTWVILLSKLSTIL